LGRITYRSTTGRDHSRGSSDSAKGDSGTQFRIELDETLERVKRGYAVRGHNRYLVFETRERNARKRHKFPNIARAAFSIKLK
jgi:hypothetical protein